MSQPSAKAPEATFEKALAELEKIVARMESGELSLEEALANHKRDEYVLSTKIGRIILDEIDPNSRDLGEKSGLFEHGRHNRIVHDYSADGVRRSIGCPSCRPTGHHSCANANHTPANGSAYSLANCNFTCFLAVFVSDQTFFVQFQSLMILLVCIVERAV